MFRGKITGKLSLYFAIALLIFAVIIGSVFMILFKNHTLDLYKIQLADQATDIAQTIPLYLEKGGQGIRGFSMYLRVIGDVAGTDVWIVDPDLNLITGGRGPGQMVGDYDYADLPPNAGTLVEQVLTGKVDFSEDFSNLLSEPTLTVGAPIITSSGQIIGAVLVHSPVKGTNEAIWQGLIILAISMALALIVSFLFALVFSFSFAKPLVIMKKIALQLIRGDYSAKTNISQADEIGQLASTLDILAQRLDLASQESEKLEVMRREFVANVSHELRTPVTVIRGSLEALVDKVVTDPDQVEDYHAQMLKESKFLQRLVEDLLELSKLQSIDFAIEKSKLSFFDVIEDAVSSVGPLAKKKGVAIRVVKNMPNLTIMGDYGRIRQMVMIILDNAIKFSPENETVEMVLENNKLFIKDNGSGIEAAYLPYIFDRFYKARSEQNKEGTGLGLAIAKNIASRHGIGLTAENAQDGGAIFIFDLKNTQMSHKEET